MTKHSACLRAARHWAHLGTTFATIRRTSVVDRYEVGYQGERRVVLGAGPSREIAFERAASSMPTPNLRPSREEAEGAVRAFLRREGIRSFELVEDGESTWAFWPTSQSHTTSYYHANGSIEWYGQGR